MQKLFIPYPLAVIAKEKGFDEPCIAEYYKGKLTFYKNLDESFKPELEAECDLLMTYTNSHPNHTDKENTHCAPLYQQVIDWFREKHKIHIQIYIGHDENKIWYNFELEPVELGYNYEPHTCDTDVSGLDYYGTLNKAIEQAFKLI